MKVICTAGHIHEANGVRHEETCSHKLPTVNGKTPICKRRIFDIEKLAERLANEYFSKYLQGGNTKDQIRELLLQGKFLKTGYTTSSIQGCHDHHVFIMEEYSN